MRHPENATWWQGDREIFPEDIAYIHTCAKRFPGLSRKELTYTLCEHLEWLTPAGRPKYTACAKLLARLEEAGELRLPAIQKKIATPAPGPAHRGVRAPGPIHRRFSRGRSRSSKRFGCNW